MLLNGLSVRYGPFLGGLEGHRAFAHHYLRELIAAGFNAPACQSE